MQEKVLVIDYEKCTGCRACELACSVFHTGASNPSRSRIKVIKWEDIGLYLPLSCQHCEKPFCVEVCPTKACHIDPKRHRILIDKNLCIGCKTCILACPFGSPIFDKAEHITVKCDYCDDDPQCVRFCEVGAIKYLDVAEMSGLKQYASAEKHTKVLRRLLNA
ncbi:4Fe-4S dicluster domain-containing protein [Chloroflexota bacterium]